MFSHINSMSLAIRDPISVQTQDILIRLYVLMSGNHRGICVNGYNPCNRRNYQNQNKSENSYYKYAKKPFL